MEQKQQKKFTFYYETEEDLARLEASLEAFQRETGFSYEPFSPPVREDVSESVAAALPAVIPETPLKSAQPQPQPQPQPLQQMPVFPSTDVAAAAAPEDHPVTIVGGGRFVRISFSSKKVLAATTEPRPNVSVLCVDVFKGETENEELGMVDASYLSAGERRMHTASFAVSEAEGLLPRTQPPRGAKKGISADQRGPPDSAPQFTEPFSRDLPEAVWKNAKTVALIYKTVLAFLELDDVKTNLRDPSKCPHVIIRCKSGVNRSRVIASILRLLLANGVFHADVRKALQTSVLHDLSDDQRLVWDEPFVFAVVSAVNGLKLGQLRETLTRDYVTKDTLTRDYVTKESHTTLQKSFEQFQRYLEKRLNGQTTLSFEEFQAQEAVSAAAAAAAAAPSAEGETAEPEAKRQKH